MNLDKPGFLLRRLGALLVFAAVLSCGSTETESETKTEPEAKPEITIEAKIEVKTETPLSDNDKKICRTASKGTAQDVFGVAPLADNEDIKKQASRIQFGSSAKSDGNAMKEILRICRDKGWKP